MPSIHTKSRGAVRPPFIEAVVNSYRFVADILVSGGSPPPLH